MGTRCADNVIPLYPKKLALTSPTGGGRSVGIVRSRTKATEYMVYVYFSRISTGVVDLGLLCKGFSITHGHTIFVKIHLDKWSALRRDLYLISHNTHKRQISMPTAGFENTIPISERPQAHASVRVEGKVWVHLLNSFGLFQDLVNTLMKFWFS